MLIDTHSHIYLNKNMSVEEIVEWLKKDNIEKIICVWIDLETSKKAIEIAKAYPWKVYATIWIHPSDINQYLSKESEIFNKFEHILIENIKHIVAIWEAWFDFHWTEEKNYEKEYLNQKIFFEKQIKLAKRYSLPLIIHSRDAKDQVLELLKENDFKNFIFHCFVEDLNYAYKAIYFSQECKISFSWIVTYKSAKDLQKVAANIPLDKIIIETDCPYLAPQEVRWEENYPNNLKYTLKKVYDLRVENWKKESFEEIEQKIYQNSLDIFQIK